MNGRQRVLNLLTGSAPDRPVRGEIWPLSSGGSAAEILSAAQGIGADFCFFDQLPGAMAEARTAELATGAIVNGPWQRCLERIGWETAMTGLARGDGAVREGLRAAAAEAGSEILAWTSAGVDLILLADDIAYSKGPLMSPAQIEAELLPLYAELVKLAEGAGSIAGFHTDGQVDLVLPLLHTAGFKFYSLEPEGASPLRAWELLGVRVPLFSGLLADWLISGGFDETVEGLILREWLGTGPLALTSACGLYHADARASLRKIYEWLDFKKA